MNIELYPTLLVLCAILYLYERLASYLYEAGRDTRILPKMSLELIGPEKRVLEIGRALPDGPELIHLHTRHVVGFRLDSSKGELSILNTSGREIQGSGWPHELLAAFRKKELGWE